MMTGLPADGQQGDPGRRESVDDFRESGGRLVGVNRDQVASGLCSESDCRVQLLRTTDGRNDDRIDERLRDSPIAGWGIDRAFRNPRKLKQIVVRLYLERSGKFSNAFLITQVRASFHLGGHPTVRRYPPTTRTGWCSHARGWAARPRPS